MTRENINEAFRIVDFVGSREEGRSTVRIRFYAEDLDTGKTMRTKTIPLTGAQVVRLLGLLRNEDK